MSQRRVVLVAGDVIIDNQLYRGTRSTLRGEASNGTRALATHGGAAVLHELLTVVCEKAGPEFATVHLSPSRAALDTLPASLHAHAVWKACPQDAGGKESQVWRLVHPLGYGYADEDTVELPAFDGPDEADVLVLDDGALHFRNNLHQASWPALLKKREADVPAPKLPDALVLKTSSPLCDGDLWHAIKQHEVAARTVVVTSIDEIRRERVRVSSGLSWERTAMDLAEEIRSSPSLRGLGACRQLVVTIGLEGALLVDFAKADGPRFELVFDPAHMEGEWSRDIPGQAIGYMTCLTASVAAHLMRTDNATDNLRSAVQAGLCAMRALLRHGHGQVGKGTPGFPFEEVAAQIQEPTDRWARVPVPASPGSEWSIINCSHCVSEPTPLFGLAKRVAVAGTSALTDVPYESLGELFTVDRTEIERLRIVRRLIGDYARHDKGRKPLSLAVFGPPGSGKSFCIKQIAQELLGDDAKPIEFNLSQFSDPRELIGALHQVRDRVLTGKLPIVFWDEFDSREWFWLQYLLAPMQDGAFQDGQITHSVGKCVFVFAGGTSYDFKNFGPAKGDPDWKRFKASKGPDFKSRLAGYIDVLGPNRRLTYDAAANDWVEDPLDVCFPVRRALLMRSILGLDEDRVEDRVLDIDPAVLAGLVELPEYKHGARSLETLLRQFDMSGEQGRIMRSDIPSSTAFALHASFEEFMAIVNRDHAFQSSAEAIAPVIHGFYTEHVKAHSDVLPWVTEYEKLSGSIKASNRAAAQRIPEVLALAGIYVLPDTDGAGHDPLALEAIEQNIEVLAEAEHGGWWEDKLRNGYRYGPVRNEPAKIHPSLRPYRQLSEKDREKDRHGVRCYDPILKLAGYRLAMHRSSKSDGGYDSPAHGSEAD